MNDVYKNKVNRLVKRLKSSKPKFMEVNDLIKKCDLIIESAAKDAVKDILANKNLDNDNKKLLVMSTGGLIDNLGLLEKIKDCEIFLPSGAIAGLDAIKAVSGRIKSLKLTTTKPVKGLENAPYVLKNRINLKKIRNKKIIFEGSLKNAINGFPQNINVAATLFLASRFKNIRVKIVADKNTRYNTHEIEATGNFGIIKTATNNIPSKNPRTSYLAVMSAINLLKALKNNVKIGN
ncbi:DUF108 domain-containing protein [Candidatus Woesearchaeota archaeon]|nr:DUF108 domain-containing protein [Candidatus Woesearchaeota archaeon]